MAVEYEITLTDYLAAQKLHAKWSKYNTQIRNLIWGLLLSVAIVSFFVKEYLAASGAIGAIAGSFFIPFLWNNVVAQIIFRIKFKNLTISQKNQAISVLESGLGYGKSQATIGWKELEKWKENQEYILAYIDKVKFLIIPKRIATKGVDISELRQRLAREVGEAT